PSGTSQGHTSSAPASIVMAWVVWPFASETMSSPAIGPRTRFGFTPLSDLSASSYRRWIEGGGGAVWGATGASAMQRMPRFSAAAPALGAQRNYLQSLETEVGDKGVYVGRLYAGAPLEHSVWHARQEAARGAGRASATKDRW